MKISYEFKNYQISTHNKFVKTGFNGKKYTTKRNKMAQLIPVRRNSQGKGGNFTGIVPPLIYHIDKGETAGGGE